MEEEAEKKPSAVIGSVRAGVSSLRAAVSRIHRVIALGFATVVVSSLLGVALALNVFHPLAAVSPFQIESPLLLQVLRAFELQLSLLIALPLLAWGAGWVFDGSPRLLTVGAAIFQELFQNAVVASSEGAAPFLRSPVFFGVRALLALGIGLLAAKTFAHARGRLEAASESRRRKQPAEAPPAEPPPVDPPPLE